MSIGTTYAIPDQPLDLATMPIADKVSRYVQARYYQAHLDALQSEVRRCGGSFACGACPNDMPSDLKEHLALAIMVARDAYLSPADSLARHYELALRHLADGSAQTLLRDLVAALRALGLHFQLSPEGLNRRSIKDRRLEWETTAWLSTPSSPSSAERPTPMTELLTSFYASIEEPSYGKD